MAKTEKELQELKEKIKELNKELSELTEEELEQVAGGEPDDLYGRIQDQRREHMTV